MSEGFTDVSKVPSAVESAVPDTKPNGNYKGPSDYVIQVTLNEPIVLRSKGDGEVIEQIDGLRFRRPTAGDLIEVGGPPLTMDVYAENPMATIDFHGKRMTAMMARLSLTNPPFLSKMNTGDWMYCAYQLSPFFYPIQAKKP